MKVASVWEKMNRLGESKTPFVVFIDFELLKPIAFTLDKLEENGIQFEIENNKTPFKIPDFIFEKYPYSYDDYLNEFEQVHAEIRHGNSFLVNLTTSTQIISNLTLQEIYEYSQAKYKILFKKDFVCFSPETFVKIEKGRIATYPMKGTIDATLPNAEKILLNDLKEKAEHATIVDLLRNDLSRVARNVVVNNFRYLDKINTNHKELLQVSSKITGDLPANYLRNIGTILQELLPAGSISGAPKPKTVEIIQKTEKQARGYYTGIFGYFDGENFDSAVMIRFIEQTDNGLFYRSGGGIHAMSNPESEYKELIDKIYVPFYRKHQDIQKEDLESGTPFSTP